MSQLTKDLKILIGVIGLDGAMESIDEMIANGAATIQDLTEHLRDELTYMAKDAE